MPERSLLSTIGAFVAQRVSTKAATIFAWPSGSLIPGLLPRTRFNYESSVRPMDNSAVTGCVNWFIRNFPEAPITVSQVVVDEREYLPEHEVSLLLEEPNPFYDGTKLLMGLLVDYLTTGNAYVLKLRGENDPTRPVQLWLMPSALVTPQSPTDGSEYLTGYQYAPGTEKRRYAPEDVIHCRFGIDPRDTRKGLSPLRAVLREVFTDDEAANYTASLLRNMGVPGFLISPKEGTGTYNKEQADNLKKLWTQRFGGDRRGEPMVQAMPINVDRLGMNPTELNLRDLRRIPEERVSAALGIPAIVAGLGAGLDRCLPGDSRVWTTTGPVAIRDVRPGMVVWSVVDGRLEPRRVTNWGRAQTAAVYRIKTKNRTVRVSGNHPLLVRVPGNSNGANATRHPGYEWRRADEVTTDDHLVQPMAVPDQGWMTLPDGRPATADMMRFFGAMIGDGNLVGSNVHMSIPQQSRVAENYRELAEAVFTKQARQSGGPVAVQERLPRAPITIVESGRGFRFRTAKDARRMATLGLSGRALNKRVPGWVYQMSRDLRLAFLAGLVDTDGSIDKRGALTFAFCQRPLTEDIRDLLISAGIQCSNIGHRTIDPAALPNPGIRDSYEAFCFTASSARQVATIPFADDLYGWRTVLNRQRHRSDGFDAGKAGLSDDLGFYNVKGIEIEPPEQLYDMEVAGGGHSFIADGVVVSNSTFANMKEAREMAYENGILPVQRLIAADFTSQLLRDFTEDRTFHVTFDTRFVRVLEEDQAAKADRAVTLVQGAVATRAEGRALVDLPVDDADKVYLQGFALVERPQGDPLPEPPGSPEAASLGSRIGWALGERKAVSLGARDARFVRLLAADEDRLTDRFEKALVKVFGDLGNAMADAFSRTVAPTLMAVASVGAAELKVEPGELFGMEDVAGIVDRVVSAAGATRVGRESLERAFEQHWALVGEATFEHVSSAYGIDVVFSAADPAGRKIIAEGGMRAGLVDIERQAKDSIFRALEVGREAGEGPKALARRIRADVKVGRFTGIAKREGVEAAQNYRATMIGRAETKSAQNKSVIEAGKASGVVSGYWAIDAQTGDEHDEACVARNGQTYDADSAESEELTHPNCSLSWVPVIAA